MKAFISALVITLGALVFGAHAQQYSGYNGGNFVAKVTPNCVVYATAGGTSDALTTSMLTNPSLPCSPTQTLLSLTLTATNATTTPTLQSYGYPAETIIQADRTAVPVGRLASGDVALLMNDGTHWRIMNGSSSAGAGNCTIDNTNFLVFCGYLAGSGNTSTEQVAIGHSAGLNNSDIDNIAIGQNAAANAVITESVSIGDGANQLATRDGTVNSIGLDAGYGTDANNSNFFGINAGSGLITNPLTGSEFLALGNSAGLNMTADQEGIVVGDTAGGNSNFGEGQDFIFMGDGAGAGATTAKIGDFIGIGNGAGAGLVGVSALVAQFDNVVGIGNGAVAAMNATSGAINDIIAIGDGAGGHNIGSELVAIGNGAGVSNSGANVIIISNDDPGTNTNSNYIDLGEVLHFTGIGTPSTSIGLLAGRLQAGHLTSASSCSGQPSGEIISTTGTGALVQCP